jgi:hypothetical protein
LNGDLGMPFDAGNRRYENLFFGLTIHTSAYSPLPGQARDRSETH